MTTWRPGVNLILGIDPVRERIPESLRKAQHGLAAFCREAIEAAAPHINGVKINLAFFEAEGSAGLKAMEDVLAAIPDDLPVIGDAKRGDIGSSSERYAKALYETWSFNAATVNPLMGRDAIEPFLNYTDRTTFLLARTSNPGAADFLEPLGFFERLLDLLEEWGPLPNAGLVIGANRLDATIAALNRFPEVPILAPGLGAQGAELEPFKDIVGIFPQAPILFPLSRAILYPEAGSHPDNIGAAAREWKNRLDALKST